MTKYLWTLRCDEAHDDGSVTTTTKELATDDTSFSQVLYLLPCLLSGSGFSVSHDDFEYRGYSFAEWAINPDQTRWKSMMDDYHENPPFAAQPSPQSLHRQHVEEEEADDRLASELLNQDAVDVTQGFPLGDDAE